MPTNQVNDYIRQEMSRLHIPGLSLAVVQGGQPVLMVGYGWANLEWEIAAAADTVYEIASVTKLFTAMGVMMLVESGQLLLQATVGEYLAKLPPAWRDITLQHILTHQSGLKPYTDMPRYWETTRHDLSREEILDLVRDQPLRFAPGERSAYDNTGYYLLGLILERVTGLSYADFLQEWIFTPLQMNDTRANDYAVVVPRRAAGYTLRHDQRCNKPYYSTAGTFSAGILLSTVADLAKWDVAVRRHALIAPQTHVQMLTPHPSRQSNEQEFGYSHGLGWFLLQHKDHPFAGHNGGIQGFASSYVHFLQRDLTIIMLCNLDNIPAPHEIALRVADFYLSTAPELSPPSV